MSILLLPHNIPDSLKHLSNLMDDIWYYAGDRSTDVSGSDCSRSPFSSTHIIFPISFSPPPMQPQACHLPGYPLPSHRTLYPKLNICKNAYVKVICCSLFKGAYKTISHLIFCLSKFSIGLAIVFLSQYVILCFTLFNLDELVH